MVNSRQWRHSRRRWRGARGTGNAEQPWSITQAESYNFYSNIVHHFGMKRNEGNDVHMFCILVLLLYLINSLFIHDNNGTLTTCIFATETNIHRPVLTSERNEGETTKRDRERGFIPPLFSFSVSVLCEHKPRSGLRFAASTLERTLGLISGET